MYGFLYNLGLNVAILRPGIKAGDLYNVIIDFNNLNSSVNVLVAALYFTTRLNLYKCCYKMLIIKVSLLSIAIKRLYYLQLLSAFIIYSC
jgi:hypothetical protein